MKMHADEVGIDAGIVHALLSTQFPDLARLPLTEFDSTGTVNAVYRLGDELYVRLPRAARWSPSLAREGRWLPKLAPFLSLEVPQPVAQGSPSPCYPLPWAVYRWIDGDPYRDELVDDERRAAEDLARFVSALRRIPIPADAPRGGRDPLRQLDPSTRAAIESGRGVIDSDAALAAWQRCLQAPPWDGGAAWIHTDLLRPNLLVRDGRLSAVIDFGGAGVGDPAADVIAAWAVFGRAGREVFRSALAVDEGTWLRACGFALHQAAVIIPYYADTNPQFAALARRTVEQILDDVS